MTAPERAYCLPSLGEPCGKCHRCTPPDTYAQAKADPVAALILRALHEQDARTYMGHGGDIGTLALEVADAVRVLLAPGRDGAR